MKKSLITFAALLLAMGLAGSSDASLIDITDTTAFTATGTDPAEDLVDYWYGTVNKLDGPLDFIRWTHHFEFDPPALEILSGTLTVSLKDDNDFCWWPCEFAFGWAEDGTWDVGEVDTDTYTYSVTASYLADGAFTVTLTDVLGDFYIDQSELTITYKPIPIPSTMLLLWSGLVGILLFKKKMV